MFGCPVIGVIELGQWHPWKDLSENVICCFCEDTEQSSVLLLTAFVTFEYLLFVSV